MEIFKGLSNKSSFQNNCSYVDKWITPKWLHSKFDSDKLPNSEVTSINDPEVTPISYQMSHSKLTPISQQTIPSKLTPIICERSRSEMTPENKESVIR